MLEVLGKTYFIDVDKLVETCRPVYTEKEKIKNDKDDPKQLELNVFKFECYKSCLDRVLNDYQMEGDEDDMSAFTNKSTNTSFGIAFNTLLRKDIITTEDE